jgi:ribonuclease III
VHSSEKLMFALQESLPKIEERLGYRFQDRPILTQAFIHRSFLNECQFENLIANERLEFLGDAVLNLYVSAFLFARFPDRGEGPLSKQKAQAVCQASCAVMMEHLGLIDYLLVGKGEQTLLAKSRPSLGSDLFEAIVGAIYVDGGWCAAERFLSSHFDTHFALISDTNPSNAKAELQELLAKQGKGLPEYKLKEMTGPPHDRIFCVAVLVAGQELGEATGKTKREAEQRAASQALSTINPM